ncbi:MAG: ribosome silencing factor [Desulfuromonas sp.]|nr:MAG: ribosome silencing factor [Desulfuromonas sp.]
MKADEQARLCAECALDKKAFNLKLLQVSGISSLTDYILIASGRSDRQVQAIAEGVRIDMKKKYGIEPLAIEGVNEGRWVLLDYGDVMVHAFQEPVREFYDLEGLWCDAPEIDLSQLTEPGKAAAEL